MAYNGWSNYETWNVALWLDNDQCTQSRCTELAQEAFDATDEDDSVDDRKDEAARELAGNLRSMIDDGMPTVEGMYADLLEAALSEVDWREIAEHYLADLDWDEIALPADVEGEA